VEDLASLKGNEDRIPRSEIWWRQWWCHDPC
jgi:hypothetical protein